MLIVKTLFEALLWPAVAGNVIWSLITVIFELNYKSVEYFSHLIILLSLSVYLVFGYLQTKFHTEITCGKKYWCFEGLHLFIISSVAVCIVGTTTKKYVPMLLVLYFSSVIFAHAIDAWNESNRKKKFKLISTNSFGIALVALSFLFFDSRDIFLAVAMLGTVTIWMLWARRDDLLSLGTLPPTQSGT